MTSTAPQLLPYLERLLDGETVEWKTLGEVAELYTGLSGKNKEHFQKGNAPYVTYKNIFENLAVDSSILEMVSIGANEHQHAVQYGDVLITGSSENIEEVGMSSVVTFHPKTEIYLNSFSFGIHFHSSVQLSPEFTKYLFRSDLLRKQIMKTASGVTRFNVSKKKFSTIIIPLPPLRVQARIVEILDKFTQLEDELAKELEARNKQYDFYRNRLLDFAHRDDFDGKVEWKTLGEVFNTRNGYTPSKANEDFWQDGTIPWFRMDDIRANGRILYDSALHITPQAVKRNGLFKANSILLATTATIGEHALLRQNALANQQLTNFEIKEEFRELLIPKFAFYYFFIINEWCKANARQNSLPSVDVQKLRKEPFPLPPLSEQRRIVEILDRFDTLTSSISEGLPREIALRRKQYEYYRDALLRFPQTTPTA